MEVMIQTTLPTIIQSKFDLDFDFDFNSTPFSSNSTAPSTPKRRFNDSFYFSAPTSPTTKASEFSPDFNGDDDDDDDEVSSKSVIPFDWEEKPGTPKSLNSSKLINDDGDHDFAFDFSTELEKASLSAEELFHGGKIKPLKPPPGFNLNEFAKNQNPISSKSPKASFFSPKLKKKQGDEKTEHETRGRELIITKNNSSRRVRETRSLSPYRVNSHYPFDESENLTSSSPSSTSTTTTRRNSSKNRKWSFRNFLLFRSASEGRADKKDPLRKYFSFFRKHDDGDGKHSRLQKQQKTESFNSGLMKKKKGAVSVSAHEMLYMKNRAVSEDLKKRSFLPYKHGIMGRFSFNYVSST